MKLKFALIVSTAVAFTSCKPKLDADTPEKGSMDPTRFVALGGSTTAGFADGALYAEGQEYSVGNILATQFQLVGGGSFLQPLMPSSSVGIGFTGKSKSILGYKTDCTGATSLSPIPFIAAGGDLVSLGTSVYSSPFNNMGVPGLSSNEMYYPGYGNPANGVGNYNPFFARMASNPATSTVLSDAVAANPTFFSLNIGEQDILNYALNGGGAAVINPVNGAAGIGFDGSITTAVTTLSANGAKGVIGNIPDVTLYPFFNTIPYNGLKLDMATAQLLTNALGQQGMSFTEGNNAFVIQDNSLPLGARQMKPGEYILLSIPLDSVKCNKMGSLIPIPERYVLTLEEVANIKAATNSYNGVISQVASTYGLALADVNTFLKSVKTGVIFNGIGLNANFVSGGTFSLDGIHLNPIGNAMVSNVFIKAINKTFGSTIPQVDATKYRGVKFP
jgi:hypothetical protein